jgi:hypothetical protein
MRALAFVATILLTDDALEAAAPLARDALKAPSLEDFIRHRYRETPSAGGIEL